MVRFTFFFHMAGQSEQAGFLFRASIFITDQQFPFIRLQPVDQGRGRYPR